LEPKNVNWNDKSDKNNGAIRYFKAEYFEKWDRNLRRRTKIAAFSPGHSMALSAEGAIRSDDLSRSKLIWSKWLWSKPHIPKTFRVRYTAQVIKGAVLIFQEHMQARDVLWQIIADEIPYFGQLVGGEIGGNSCILRIDYPTINAK